MMCSIIGCYRYGTTNTVHPMDYDPTVIDNLADYPTVGTYDIDCPTTQLTCQPSLDGRLIISGIG
jgi:hypothetical protein